MNAIQTTGSIVIIVLLSILLVVAIVFVVILIKILRHVQKLSEKVEDVTTNFSDLVKMVSKKVAPVALSTAVAAALRRIKSAKGVKDE